MKKVFVRLALVFIVAIGLVTACVLLSDKDEQKLLVSKQKVPHGTIITESNFDDYIYILSTDKSMKPDDAVIEKEDILGHSLLYDIAGNTIIAASVLSNEDECLSGMVAPVIAGIRATDISQFVCGIVRKGDYIDISVVDSITGESADVLQNVYVWGAYNADGTIIEDNNGYAMNLNVLIEKEHEKHLNSMLSKGTIRICKHEKGYADE